LLEVKKFHRGSISRVNLAELKFGRIKKMLTKIQTNIATKLPRNYHEIALKFAKSKPQIQRIVTKKLGHISQKNRRFIGKPTQQPKPLLGLK